MEEDETLSVEEALAFLKHRVGLISGVVLSGGEPLLHEELPSIARRIASFGLAVKLDTNGSFPERIAAIHADFVSLDLKTSPARYATLAPSASAAGTLVLESLRLLRNLGKPFEVRVTCAPGFVESADIDAMAAILDPRDDIVLQPFRPGGCLDPAWDAFEPTSEALLVDYLSRIKAVAPKARIRGQSHQRP